jgi:transcriptional regulator with XRE-family HTH domain
MEGINAVWREEPIRLSPRSPVLDALAANVHRHRGARGWSFATLARHAHTSVSLVKHIEKRRSDPSVSVLFRLANAFGVRVAQLVEDAPLSDSMLSEATPPVACYANIEQLAAALGPRARSHRLRRNWDRRRFAAAAGISTGTVHYLETNANEPTTTVIERVANAFGMSFAELVEPASSPVLRIVRADDASRDAAELQKILFAESTPAGALAIAECHLEGRRSCLSGAPLPPGSTSMLYVLKGTIRVHFESEEHVLRRGDLFVFAAEPAVTIANEAASSAQFLRIDRAQVARATRGRAVEP